MRLKNALPVILACLLPLWVAQAESPESAYAAAQSLISACPTCPTKANGQLFGYLRIMARSVSSTIPQDILSYQEDLAANTDNNVQIRREALSGLWLQHTQAVETVVSGYLSDTSEEMRHMAGQIMLKWGQFGTPVSVLLACEDYEPLLRYSVPGAADSLLAATGTASPAGRISAALAHDRKSSTKITTAVAYSLLDTYVTKGEKYSNLDNLNRAVFDAYEYCDTTWNALSDAISNGVADSSRNFRMAALRALVRFAQNEEVDAVAMLLDLTTKSPYIDMRENADFHYVSLSTSDPRYRIHP